MDKWAAFWTIAGNFLSALLGIVGTLFCLALYNHNEVSHSLGVLFFVGIVARCVVAVEELSN